MTVPTERDHAIMDAMPTFTPQQAVLLGMLDERRGMILPHADASARLQSESPRGRPAGESVVKVQVCRIRAALGAQGWPLEIDTVHGVGYRLRRTDPAWVAPWEAPAVSVPEYPSRSGHCRRRSGAGQWTPEECDEVLEMDARGMSAREIAAKLDRTSKSVGCKLRHLRETAAREADEAGPAEAAPPEPEPEPATKTGPWTADEEGEALELDARGLSTSAIAQRLGRSGQAVGPKLRHLREAAAREADEGDEAPPDPAPETRAGIPPDASPAPAQAPDGSQGSAPDRGPPGGGGQEHVPYELRQLRMRLDDLGHVAPWTPERDLALVEGLARGRKLAVVGEELGLAGDECRWRFKRLCPEPSIDAQAQLLGELRRRVECAGGDG